MSKASAPVPAASRAVNSELLFEVPKIPRHRISHRAEIEALKTQHGIQTHCMPEFSNKGRKGRNWMALSMPAACAKLDGYKLTDEEKSDLCSIVAGYGRLLDECGLLIDGAPTEFQAVKAAVAASKLP